MKTLVIAVLVLFVGFWMVEAPNQLAEFASDGAAWLWQMTTTVFSSLIDFLGSLFS